MSTLAQNEQQNFIQEDEIDLRELWQTIKDGKRTVFLTTAIIVFFTLIFALRTPNTYSAQAVLVPTEIDKGTLSSLGSLAAMAGVNIGGSAMTPDVAFQSLLDNYEFMHSFVLRHKIDEYYFDDNLSQRFVFALGFDGLYQLTNSPKDWEDIDREEEIFKLVEAIQKNFSISSDKKSGLITVAYSDYDRVFAPQMVNKFLEDASKYLVENELANIESRLRYFQEELTKAEGIELRQNISSLISSILEKQIMTKSKKYYQCDALSMPFEPYIKDKTKPKRGLIMVVGAVTGVILGVFLVLFLAFIRKEEQEAPQN
ncbi:MAG: hypothetical protein IE916_11715 [Epsilonproteobacteria bacterium]|nr:hypothetical protein [Campylobacterota bacterium]